MVSFGLALGCPANWTAYARFLRRCYSTPQSAPPTMKGKRGPGLSPVPAGSVFVRIHDCEAWRAVVIRPAHRFEFNQWRFSLVVRVPNMELKPKLRARPALLDL